MTVTPATKEFEPLLAEMLGEGATYQDIAIILGKSRSAVAGMVRRLGLKSISGNARPKGWTARKIRLALPPAPLPIGPIGDFPDGRSSCRHIAGSTGADFQCCGHPGYPYCEFHRGTNYTKRVAK